MKKSLTRWTSFSVIEEQRASLNAEIGRVLAEITAHLGDGRKNE